MYPACVCLCLSVYLYNFYALARFTLRLRLVIRYRDHGVAPWSKSLSRSYTPVDAQYDPLKSICDLHLELNFKADLSGSTFMMISCIYSCIVLPNKNTHLHKRAEQSTLNMQGASVFHYHYLFYFFCLLQLLYPIHNVSNAPISDVRQK